MQFKPIPIQGKGSSSTVEDSLHSGQRERQGEQ